MRFVLLADSQHCHIWANRRTMAGTNEFIVIDIYHTVPTEGVKNIHKYLLAKVCLEYYSYIHCSLVEKVTFKKP
jgi:hypothetical protein